MSVSILYSRLFNLSTFHDYFQDGRARNIRLTPTAETSELLNGGRMLFKEIPKGITVLYRTLEDEISPFVDLGPDARLSFSLKTDYLNELLNITNLDESISNKFKSGNILYFKNDPTSPSNDPALPEDLIFELIDFLAGNLFTYEFTVTPPLASPGDVLLTVSDEDGNPVAVVNKTVSIGEDGIYRQQIDLRDKPKGKYTITIRKSSDNAFIKDATFYSDDLLVGQKVLGIVDIEFNSDTNHIYTDTWEFAIRLSRKSTVWKYYIVDKTMTANLDTFDLSIHDEDSPDPKLPYASPYTFVRDGDEPHANVRINGLDTIIFKSDVLIPFYQVPKLNLQLKKIPSVPGDTTEIIISKNLPNPRHNGVVKEESGILESEIYVFI